MHDNNLNSLPDDVMYRPRPIEKSMLEHLCFSIDIMFRVPFESLYLRNKHGKQQ